MYSSSSISKHLLLIPFLVVVATQLLFICNASQLNLTNTYLHHKCLVSQGKYNPGSEYEKTLNNLVRLLTRFNFSRGFNHVTIGEAPINVTIKYQCRGDSYGSKCQSCFNDGILGLRRRCPRNKGGIIWFDQCFVELTSINMIDARSKNIDYENNFSLHNPNKVSGDANSFNKETTSFLKMLTLKANNENNKGENGEMALYASGEKKLGGTMKLYAMVQCIRDKYYMTKLCKECLETIISEFSKCCDGKQGGRILGEYCTFRYELYPFLRA
ncbi:unnamed protein product [Cochlearia groenlandica]